MRINWKISKDNSKALLNSSELEVEIRRIKSIEDAVSQRLSSKYATQCGFIKIDSNNVYECLIIKNNMSNFIDSLNIETASKLIPKLFSSLGDIYEER